MEQTDEILCVRESAKSIKLTWKGIPFNSKITVHWRGIPIHISVIMRRVEYGWESAITFIHNNELFRCKLTKWKNWGGRHGDYPPVISTSEKKLIIVMSAFSLVLKDESIDPASVTAENDDDPFSLLPTPTDVVFEKQ
jgi:hypothetical protein